MARRSQISDLFISGALFVSGNTNTLELSGTVLRATAISGGVISYAGQDLDVRYSQSGEYFTSSNGDIRYAQSGHYLISGHLDASLLGILSSGHILSFDGSSWVNKSEAGAVASTVPGLNDTVISSPVSGQYLAYNGEDWINAEASGLGGGSATNVESLTDVTIVGTITSGHALKYNGTGWVNGFSMPSGYLVPSGDYATTLEASKTLQGLTDVGVWPSTPTSGHVLAYDGSSWNNAFMQPSGYQVPSGDYTTNAETDEQYIRLDGSNDPITGSLTLNNNIKLLLGSSDDSSVYFNAENLIIDPQDSSATAKVLIPGDLVVSGNIYVAKSTNSFFLQDTGKTTNLQNRIHFQDKNEAVKASIGFVGTNDLDIKNAFDANIMFQTQDTNRWAVQGDGDLVAQGTHAVSGNSVLGVFISGKQLAYGGIDTDVRYALSGEYILEADQDLTYLRLDGTNDPITGDIAFNDSVKAFFGTSNDSSIYHNGTNLIVDSQDGTTTSDLYLKGTPTWGTKISGGSTGAGNIWVQNTAPHIGFVELGHSNGVSEWLIRNNEGSLQIIDRTGTANTPIAVFTSEVNSSGSEQNAYFFSSGCLWFNADNKGIELGPGPVGDTTGPDASIVYDGTDLVINPKVFGTGKLAVLGDISGSTISSTNLVYANQDTDTRYSLSGHYIESHSNHQEVGVLASGQILSWNGINWVNKEEAAAIATSIDGLTNVSTSNKTSGQVLTWDDTNWVNSTPFSGYLFLQNKQDQVRLADGVTVIHFGSGVASDKDASIGGLREGPNGAVNGLGFDLNTGGNHIPTFKLTENSGYLRFERAGSIKFDGAFEFKSVSGIHESPIVYTSGTTTWAVPWSVSGLYDYSLNGTLASGQALSWNGSYWVNADVQGVGGGATTLEALTDTDTTSALSGQVLAYDGSDWVDAKNIKLLDNEKFYFGTDGDAALFYDETANTFTYSFNELLNSTDMFVRTTPASYGVKFSGTDANPWVQNTGPGIGFVELGFDEGDNAGASTFMLRVNNGQLEIRDHSAGANKAIAVFGGAINNSGTTSESYRFYNGDLQFDNDGRGIVLGENQNASMIYSSGLVYLQTHINNSPTNSGMLYVSGNVSISGRIIADNFGQLNGTLESGQSLTYDGTNWVNAMVAGTGGGGDTTLAAHTDTAVDPTLSVTQSGHILSWNGTDWVNIPSTAGTSIASLSDTSIGTKTSGQHLVWNDTHWVNSGPPRQMVNYVFNDDTARVNTKDLWIGNVNYDLWQGGGYVLPSNGCIIASCLNLNILTMSNPGYITARVYINGSQASTTLLDNQFAYADGTGVNEQVVKVAEDAIKVSEGDTLAMKIEENGTCSWEEVICTLTLLLEVPRP